MVLDGGTVVAVITILGLVGKQAVDHFQIKTLTTNDEKNKKRINDLETEKTRMTEALDRSYATKEFVYQMFISRSEHEKTLQHLEEKMVGQMEHINEHLESIRGVVERNWSAIPIATASQK